MQERWIYAGTVYTPKIQGGVIGLSLTMAGYMRLALRDRMVGKPLQGDGGGDKAAMTSFLLHFPVSGKTITYEEWRLMR
jgi:hypothetical protein